MRSIRIAGFAISTGLVFAGHVSAQKPPPVELPHFDIRHENGAADSGIKPTVQQDRASLTAYAATAFGSGAEQIKIHLNSFGWPKVAFKPGGVLAATEGRDTLSAARAFLATHFPLVPFRDHEREQLRLVQEQSWNGLSQVTLQQVAGGLPVWGGHVKVTVNRDFEVVHLMVGDIAPGAALDPTPRLIEMQAVRIAAVAADLELPEELVPLSGSSSHWTYFQHPSPGGAPIIVQLTAFPMDASSLRLAYRLFVDGLNHDSYEILIDANTGALLYRQDVVDRMGQARVWRKSPIHGGRELVTFPDGWLPEGGTVTTGNNVDAFLDRDFDQEPDDDEIENIENGRAVSADQVFDFPADELGQNPFNFAAASVTNAFFYANEAHDYYYNLGFTEEAGNFQVDNFDRGGVGGDPFLVATQTPFFGAAILSRPEGISPRIRIGFTPGPDVEDPSDTRDLAYNAQTMIHEYGHGVTNRIIGGVDDVNCLNRDQSRALGEGWSDYFAASYVDDPVIGAYWMDNQEQGIRRHSLKDYPFTYQDFANEGYEIHDNGEIWAATLWDLHNELGQETADRLVVDALRLTPCTPSMADAKDAIVMAAQTMNGVVSQQTMVIDETKMHAVFARHGLGHSASGLDGFVLVDSITFNAAFDMPPAMGENQNPTISGRIDQPARYLNQFTYRISAADPDGDSLTYELIEGPAGLRVDDMGLVRWLVTRFTPQRVKIKIADGKGGEIIHGFTIPVATTLTQDQPVELSASEGELGLIRFIVPEGTNEPVMQVRLRTADGSGDGELRVFPPQSFSDVSFRDGSDETLTFASPPSGRWGVHVIGFRDFDNITLDFTFPSATELESNKVHGSFSGVTSSETFYSFSVPDGITALTVSTGGGSGDLDLFLAKARYPICQFSFAVSQECDFDEFSGGPVNFEEITIRDEEPTSSQASIKGPATVRVEAGQYFINLSAFAAYEGVSITLSLDAGDGIPAISLGGIVNAASFGLAVSPGSIASVFGTSLGEETMAASSVPLPREMAGVKILVDGVEAPLFFVSPGQLNFQAPFEIATPNLGAVSVEVNGVPSTLSPFAAILNAPGIFTYNRVPDELDPVIVHADGSLVTPENPARPGEVLIIFATGLGELSNIPATGEATPTSPLATLQRTAIVEVGTQESEVLFAGLAPGFVGLAQFNIRLPANMPTGEPALSMLIRVQAFESEPVNLHVGAVGGN